MELALEVKFHLDFHWVTRPWRRTLTNGSDVKYVFPAAIQTRVVKGTSVQASASSLFSVAPIILSPESDVYSGRLVLARFVSAWERGGEESIWKAEGTELNMKEWKSSWNASYRPDGGGGGGG